MTATLPAVGATSRPVAVPRRGRTTVSDLVIEKIASQAALEIPQVGGRAAHRLLGVSLPRSGSPAAARPRVTAHVDGRLARITMSIGVHYPAPLRQVAATTRERVVETVARLAALDVREVDIDVVALPRDRTPVRRVR